ncbi:hypothetical protein GF373_08095 [bacterium]|nr:hypothetical protein [bacterium]
MINCMQQPPAESCDRIPLGKDGIEFDLGQKLILILLFVLPVAATSFSVHMFEVPKVFFLRLFTLLLVVFVWRQLMKGNFTYTWDRPIAIVTLLLGLFLLSNIMATAFSIDWLRSLIGTYDRQNGLLTTACFVAIAAYLTLKPLNDTFYRIIPILYFLTSCIAAVVGFFQWHGFGWLPGWENSLQFRPHGTLHYVNTFAAYSVIGLLLGWYLFIRSHQNKLYIFLGLLFLHVMLIATYSRGAWLTLGFGLVLLLAWTAYEGGKKHALQLGLALAIALPLSGGVFYLIKPPVYPTASSDFQIFGELNPAKRLQSSADTRESTIESRLEFWRVAGQIVREYPFFGSGPETYHLLYPRYRSVREGKKIDLSSTVENVHNFPLHVASNQGVITLLLWVGLYGYVFVRAGWQLLTHRGKYPQYFTGCLLIAGCTSMLGQMVNPHSLSGNLFEWICLALLARKYHILQQFKSFVCPISCKTIFFHLLSIGLYLPALSFLSLPCARIFIYTGHGQRRIPRQVNL